MNKIKHSPVKITFRDQIIDALNLINIEHLAKLIIEHLCGEQEVQKVIKDIIKDSITSEHLKRSAKQAKENGLNYEQFNELLLLLNQDRVTRDFFEFFFKRNRVTFDDLKKGITNFKGFAMLCFGNFRFAYKYLITKKKEEIEEKLDPYHIESSTIIKEFESRPSKILEIERIPRDETWYLGFISQKKYEIEEKHLETEIKRRKSKVGKEFSEVAKVYIKIGERIKNAKQKALKNTRIYLTWDYLDVYIATSMRYEWEFSEAFDFIQEVFNDSRLKKLNLRYFDPTQSICRGRIDKGLIEGLMLKRVFCSIYMSQESDTMGKDAELAATLAQGKPVIAFVPRIEMEEYCNKISSYPLDFFEKRFLILEADGMFSNDEFISAIEKEVSDFQKEINTFRDELSRHRASQSYSLWDKKENKFKQNLKQFSIICRILAIAEQQNYEKRARTLKEMHPLAIQVDLKTGVANGVLVVRSAAECVELLYRILVNSLDFTIKRKKINDKLGKFIEVQNANMEFDVTVLEENISGCPFRVVTNDEKLTNSFWNFYLTNK